MVFSYSGVFEQVDILPVSPSIINPGILISGQTISWALCRNVFFSSPICLMYLESVGGPI